MGILWHQQTLIVKPWGGVCSGHGTILEQNGDAQSDMVDRSWPSWCRELGLNLTCCEPRVWTRRHNNGLSLSDMPFRPRFLRLTSPCSNLPLSLQFSLLTKGLFQHHLTTRTSPTRIGGATVRLGSFRVSTWLLPSSATYPAE